MNSNPTPPWQKEWQASFRDVSGLLEFLGLNAPEAPESLEWNPRFPIRVPRNYAERMGKGNWFDPLLRQVLPFHAETEERPGFTGDAVGDGEAQKEAGLLRKYQGRAL